MDSEDMFVEAETGLLMMQHLERESWALHTWWSSELERS